MSEGQMQTTERRTVAFALSLLAGLWMLSDHCRQADEAHHAGPAIGKLAPGPAKNEAP